jgi:hypothetical protein
LMRRCLTRFSFPPPSDFDFDLPQGQRPLLRHIGTIGRKDGALHMWITKDDFRIRAQNFDPSNSLNILRIICGLFMHGVRAGRLDSCF